MSPYARHWLAVSRLVLYDPIVIPRPNNDVLDMSRRMLERNVVFKIRIVGQGRRTVCGNRTSGSCLGWLS